jgi:hypothetical protein
VTRMFRLYDREDSVSCQRWAIARIRTCKVVPISDKGQKDLKFHWIPEEGYLLQDRNSHISHERLHDRLFLLDV